MGTNYYLETDVCPHCQTSKGRLHIGKASAGWCFSLHVDLEEGIRSLDDWRRLWAQPNSRIVDEYARAVSVAEMEERITGRVRPTPPGPDFDYALNDAQPGPRNLIRHRIDGRHCIGHGAGTWDLIVGEFS
jgi:hypothetical protein